MTQTANDEARRGVLPEGTLHGIDRDADPQETQEWLDTLEYVIESAGCERGAYLLERLKQRAFACGVPYPGGLTTPYVNTISVEREPEYPAIGRSSGASRASSVGTPWQWSCGPTG